MTLQVITLALGLIAPLGLQATEAGQQTGLAHVNNSFHFEIAAPMVRLAPLFGPEGERGWAGKHWDPKFLYPQPAKDVQGAVFQVQHGPHTSVWVNTLFDLRAGRMQYVAFIDSVVATTVDVKLAAVDATHTVVDVTYARTALDAAANGDVRAMGNNDRDSGPDWKKSIEECLGIAPTP